MSANTAPNADDDKGADGGQRTTDSEHCQESDTPHEDRPPTGDTDPTDSRRHDPPEQVLDYSPASGAVDPSDAAQDQSTTARTGRHSYTENATFTKEQMPAQSDAFETLNEANRNFYASDDESVGSARHEQDYHNSVHAWGEFIGLTDSEQYRASHLLEQTSPESRNGFGVATIALAALTLAANEQPWPKAIRPTVPVDSDSDLCDRYDTLLTELEVDPSLVRSCRQHLRQFL